MMISLKSPGKKFSDADLIKIPLQIICGKTLKKSNEVSLINRANKQETYFKSENILNNLIDIIGEDLDFIF